MQMRDTTFLAWGTQHISEKSKDNVPEFDFPYTVRIYEHLHELFYKLGTLRGAFSWLASKQTYLGDLIFIPTFEDPQDKNSTTSIGSLTCGLISFSVEGDCFSQLS